MKEGIRILGVDDSAFSIEHEESVITGVVYRGTEFIEEIVSAKVKVDGNDADEKLLQLFNACSNHKQIKVILVDGLSFAGLNPIDIRKISRETGKPVIAVTANQPDREKFKEALENNGKKTEHLQKLDGYSKENLEDGPIYFQYAGTNRQNAVEYIKKSIINGRTPEPIRVAHMIGSSKAKL